MCHDLPRCGLQLTIGSSRFLGVSERYNANRPSGYALPSQSCHFNINHDIRLRLTDSRQPQYDRSGRSTGVATVVFTHARDARNAQKQLDGVMAKGMLFRHCRGHSNFVWAGEAMSIKLESTLARSQAPKRNPNTNTLLSRMGKKSLADRMSADASENMDSKKYVGHARQV